jgi:hypothetical protein
MEAYQVKQGTILEFLRMLQLTITVADQHLFLQMLLLPSNQYLLPESSFELSNAADYFPQSNMPPESPISILTVTTAIFKDSISCFG